MLERALKCTSSRLKPIIHVFSVEDELVTQKIQFNGF